MNNTIKIILLYSLVLTSCRKEKEPMKDINFLFDISQGEQGNVSVELTTGVDSEKYYEVDFGDGEIKTGSFEGKAMTRIQKKYTENGSFTIGVKVFSNDKRRPKTREINITIETIFNLPEYRINQELDNDGRLHLALETGDDEVQILWNIDNGRFTSSLKKLEVFMPKMRSNIISYVVWKEKTTQSVGLIRTENRDFVNFNYSGPLLPVNDSLSGSVGNQRFKSAAVPFLFNDVSDAGKRMFYFCSFPTSDNYNLKIHLFFGETGQSDSQQERFDFVRANLEDYFLSKKNWAAVYPNVINLYEDWGNGGSYNISSDARNKHVTVIEAEEIEVIPVVSNMFSKGLRVKFGINMELSDSRLVDLVLNTELYFY